MRRPLPTADQPHPRMSPKSADQSAPVQKRFDLLGLPNHPKSHQESYRGGGSFVALYVEEARRTE